MKQVHKELADLCSPVSVFEFVCMLERLKQATWLIIPGQNVNRLIGLCCRLKIPYEMLRQGYNLRKNADLKIKRSPRSNDSRLIVAARNRRSLDDAVSAHERRDPYLGLWLSYPPCCVQAYAEWVSQNYSRYLKKGMCVDLFVPYSLSRVRELRPFPFVNNVLLKPSEITILSHVPCSPTCSKSVELGEKYLDLMRRVSPRRAAIVERALKSWILFTGRSGFVCFPRARLDDFTLRYGKCYGDASHKLLKSVDGRPLEITAYNQVALGGKRISEPHALICYR